MLVKSFTARLSLCLSFWRVMTDCATFHITRRIICHSLMPSEPMVDPKRLEPAQLAIHSHRRFSVSHSLYWWELQHLRASEIPFMCKHKYRAVIVFDKMRKSKDVLVSLAGHDLKRYAGICCITHKNVSSSFCCWGCDFNVTSSYLSGWRNGRI